MARRRYRRNPGGSSLMPMLLIGGAAFLLLRGGGLGSLGLGTNINALTPPPGVVVPQGYTWIPGRGLVQTGTPTTQLITAGVVAGIPILGNLLSRLMGTPADALTPSSIAPSLWDTLFPTSGAAGGDVLGTGATSGGLADILRPIGGDDSGGL